MIYCRLEYEASDVIGSDWNLEAMSEIRMLKLDVLVVGWLSKNGCVLEAVFEFCRPCLDLEAVLGFGGSAWIEEAVLG